MVSLNPLLLLHREALVKRLISPIMLTIALPTLVLLSFSTLVSRPPSLLLGTEDEGDNI